MKSNSTGIFSIPEEVLIDSIAPYLSTREQLRVFSTCKLWQSCLLTIRTFTMRDTTWKQFQVDDVFRLKVLQILGLLQSVEGQQSGPTTNTTTTNTTTSTTNTTTTFKTKKFIIDLHHATKEDLLVLSHYADYIKELRYHDIDSNEDVPIKVLDSYVSSRVSTFTLPVEDWLLLSHLRVDPDTSLPRMKGVHVEAIYNNHKETRCDLLQHLFRTTSLQDNTEHPLNIITTHVSPTVIAERSEASISLPSTTTTKLMDTRGIRKAYFLSNDQITLETSSGSTIQSCHIIGCHDVEDLQYFEGIPLIQLQGCPHVSDITPLQYCQQVELRYCSMILNIDPLQYVRKVSLKGLLVKDISMLSDVETLEVTSCYFIQRFPTPTPLQSRPPYQSWTFINAPRIDCTGYDQLLRLQLTNCPQCQHVETLGKIPHLMITDHMDIPTFPQPLGQYQSQSWTFQHVNLVNLEGYDHLRSLSLRRCLVVTDVSPLRQLQQLELIGCNHIESLTALQKLTHLTIIDCDRIQNIANMVNLRSLRIERDRGEEKTFENLPRLEVVALRYCKNIRNVSALGHVRDITLQACPNIRDVSRLQKVKMITIEECDGIHDIAALIHGEVEELRIKNCKQLVA